MIRPLIWMIPRTTGSESYLLTNDSNSPVPHQVGWIRFKPRCHTAAAAPGSSAPCYRAIPAGNQCIAWEADPQRGLNRFQGPAGVGKCPNWISPKYWGYNFQQIFEGDVQNPQKGTFTNPCPKWTNLRPIFGPSEGPRSSSSGSIGRRVRTKHRCG